MRENTAGSGEVRASILALVGMAVDVIETHQRDWTIDWQNEITEDVDRSLASGYVYNRLTGRGKITLKWWPSLSQDGLMDAAVPQSREDAR